MGTQRTTLKTNIDSISTGQAGNSIAGMQDDCMLVEQKLL
jgi:hypothetical protein